MRKWVSRNFGLIVVVALATFMLAFTNLVPYIPTIGGSNTLIHRRVNAYTHLPNGNTKVYYDGGALIEVEGTWYFNQPGKYYEFYRDSNSTLWHVSPY